VPFVDKARMHLHRENGFSFPSPREAAGRVGECRESDMSRGGGSGLKESPPPIAMFASRSLRKYGGHRPPMPLPATRYARGGRGIACRLQQEDECR
jgi:hypothetical protein